MKVLFGNKQIELEGVTISQYEILKDKNNVMDDIEFISLLTGLNKDDIRDATLAQISFVSKMLNTYYNTSMEKSQLKPLINYNNQMLGLIKPSTMTWGEFTDLEIITSSKPLNLRLLASILYRPCETYSTKDLTSKVVKYDYEECLERSKEMGDFLVQDVMSSLFFFIQFGKMYTVKQREFMETQKTKG